MNRNLKVFLVNLLGSAMVLSIAIAPISIVAYTQRYVQVSETSATNGTILYQNYRFKRV